MKDSRFPVGRRALLRGLTLVPGLALLPWLALAAPTRRPTPEDDWGPFYPLDWSGELDADLTRFGGRVAEGSRLSLRGRVTNRRGQGVTGAVVEIWQTDARGRYRHPGVPEHLRDPGFQGYGRVMTDDRGEYAFVTVVPGRYGGRPPHIHIHVAAPGQKEFVSQIYFSGENREGGAGNVIPPGREHLTVGRSPVGDGGFQSRFDIVLP